MAITLSDVAAKAGVSRSAVSRTFTEGASVSEKTRKKVLKAATELGYTPNYIARSLATQRTQLIGVICNNFKNPYLLEIFELLTSGLQARDLRPLLVNLTGGTDPEESVDQLTRYRVDAVILASSTLPTSFAQAFEKAGLPCIHLFGRAADNNNVCVVGINNEMGGEIAGKSLIEHGYQKPAFLGGPASATSTQDRLKGFERGLQNRGHSVAFTHFADNYSFEAGYDAMKTLLADRRDFDALFCGDDIIAMGALTAARENGICVPDELGLLGFNDTEMSRWPGVSVSTIAQPTEDIVRSAIELAQTILADPSRGAEARLYACKLIERGTLKPISDAKSR
ncbi:MAG: LacI family DNA-binding transcriptional regulator [Gammaproteobacteria bacterium]|nr:LacI family DNA-binding transcriptional regulator [Gammaproteobacteria bacterium]